jgi:transposase
VGAQTSTIASCCGFTSIRSMRSMRPSAKSTRRWRPASTPFRTAVEQVTSIPGIKDLSARAIISEIGIDMSRFATDAHLISWACLCPRIDESAGKRRSNRIRKGSPWLKTTLVHCAWAAARTKGTYLQAQFHRIRSRRGRQEGDRGRRRFHPRCRLSHAQERNHLSGPRSQPLRSPQQGAAENRLVQRLAELGFAVQLAPLPN